jgi:chemotaxis protein methyltransferase CheR
MVLGDFAMKTPGFDYMVLGTDISTRMLDRAARAVYEEERIAAVQSRCAGATSEEQGPLEEAVRMAPEIRRRYSSAAQFIDEDYRLRERMDVVFCRNVSYISTADPGKGAHTPLQTPGPWRVLFTGHSESSADGPAA